MSAPLTSPAERRAAQRAALPAVPAAVPLAALRVLLGVVGVGASVAVLPLGGWLWLALVVALVAAVRPASGAPWLLAGLWVLHAVVGSERLGLHLAVLVAAVHLVHVVGSFALALPGRGVLGARVLVRPALRFVVVQVPVQALALAAAWVTGAHRPHVPVLAVAAAAALAVVALVAVRPRRGTPR